MVETIHKAAIDPLLPAPDPAPANVQAAPGGHGAPFSCAHNHEVRSLGAIANQTPAKETSTEVGSQYLPLTHCEHTRLGTLLAIEAGNVSRGEHLGMGESIQVRIDPHKTCRIGDEPGTARPAGSTPGGGP